MNKYSKAKKGMFRPKNPSKYIGDVENIVYRSGLEKRLMLYLDSHSNILRWNSEEVIIPYRDPMSRRPRRYFPDFLVEMINVKNQKEVILIEVKSSNETRPPKGKKRRTRQLIGEERTWAVNQAKWESAKQFCDKQGWKFMIMTEKNIPK
jgi:hypothetical protein